METHIQTFGYYLKYSTYYYCSPFCWDEKKSRIELNHAKSAQIGWKLSIFLSCIVELSQIVAEIIGAATNQRSTPLTQFRQLQVLGSTLCFVCQINVAWKAQDFKELVNMCIQRFKIIKQQKLVSQSKWKKMAENYKRLMLAAKIAVHFVPFGCLLISFSEFNPQFWKGLHEVFPGRRENWNFYVFISVMILEFVAQCQQFCTLLFYAATITCAALPFTEVLKEMKRVITSKEESRLQNPDYFVIFYRSLYMLVVRMNDWAALVATFALGAMFFLVVYINFSILGGNALMILKIPLVAINLILILFSGVAIDMAGYLHYASVETLEAMGRRTDLSKYNRLRIKASRSFNIYVGNFFCIDEKSNPRIGDGILGTTVDAVITFG